MRVPRWRHAGVRSTVFEDVNREGSSMALAKVSATMTPTPGVVISSRVRASDRAIASRGPIRTRVRRDIYSGERTAAMARAPKPTHAAREPLPVVTVARLGLNLLLPGYSQPGFCDTDGVVKTGYG